MENEKKRLAQLLQKTLVSLTAKGDNNIKSWEYAFQDDISKIWPDSPWWEVCHIDIFGLMFFARKTPDEMIKIILDSVDPKYLASEGKPVDMLDSEEQEPEPVVNANYLDDYPSDDYQEKGLKEDKKPIHNKEVNYELTKNKLKKKASTNEVIKKEMFKYDSKE